MGRQLRLCSTGPEHTRRLAATVAGALRPGDVVSLSGQLGAGKTCFVQGAAAGLGVRERVTSPSFVLRRSYAGRLPVLHLDVYRLDTLQEVLELEYEQALDAGGVAFIEWGDAMSPLLPRDHLEVELTVDDDEAWAEEPPRRIVVRPHGDDWLRRFDGLAADLQPWRAQEA